MQHAYALGDPNDDDSQWMQWQKLTLADAVAAAGSIEDPAHREEFGRFVRAHMHHLLRAGATLGEAYDIESRHDAA